MAQSHCRRSVGDRFWPWVVVEKKPWIIVAIILIKVKQSHCLRLCKGCWPGFVETLWDEPPIAYDCIGGDWRRHLQAFFLLIKRRVFWPVTASCNKSVSNSNPVGGALIYTAITYDSTIRFVGNDHSKRTSRHRAPPIQSEVAGDYSQTLNLNLNLQLHTESCD